jgi:predicted transcriptional regulator
MSKVKYTVTLNPDTIQKLKELSERTMIPQSRLVESAIEDLLKKYQK